MDDDLSAAGQELTLLRHDRLRRTAPAVQHEINNAIMVLASNLELLGRSVGEGAPRRQLDRALEAVKRLDETIRGYLDAARREATDRATISPAVALRQVLPLLRVALGARLGIDLEIEEGVWQVELDRGRLDLALLSLAREAAGRLPPGSRLKAGLANRADSAEVALTLTLPPGGEPTPEVTMLLSSAATVVGGRMERVADGLVLFWPKAQGPAAA